MTTTLTLPVTRVLVLEDRAQVHRQGTLELPAGHHRLVLHDVAPVLADKTLQLACLSGTAQVGEARVRRRSLVREDDQPERIREREVQQRELQQQVSVAEARLARRETDLDQLLEARRQVLAELAEDVAWGRSEPSAWALALAPLQDHEQALRDERLDLQEYLVEHRRRLADLDALVASMRGPQRRLQADLELDLLVEQAGEISLSADYVVPCACWRPLHRATLEGQELLLETFGCVWQNTGEDWTGAALSLSTQRASLGAEPPLLGEDELRVQAKAEELAVEIRDQAIQTTGLGSATRSGAELPGIDDGGEVRTLDVQGRPPLPSDGRPHRLPLSQQRLSADSELVAMPERATAVIRRVRAIHQGVAPLLAGPVELVADGGRVGRSSLAYVAAGERFELGFGPDPALRVHRRVERVDHEPGTLSRWARSDHRVTLHLSNLATSPRRLELVERIPVSELEQVRVELDSKDSSTGSTPDADGHVRWQVELEAGGTAERVLAWQVEKKKDVQGL